MDALGRNIARLRRQAGRTQEDLARCLGVTFQAVSRWETGQSLPDAALLPALARALGTGLDELFGYAPPERPVTAYEDRYRAGGYYWGLEPNRMCYAVMALRPPVRPLRLLDVGCGEGKDAVFFAQNGYQVTGFDAAEAGLEKARALARARGVEVRLLKADLRTFRPEEEFDIIYSSGVLHYLGEDLRTEVLDHYKAHTAPGGLHALNVFVKKPFLPAPPDEESPDTLWRSGELALCYHDWRLHTCREDIFDCQSSGVPHRHCMDTLLAERPGEDEIQVNPR